MTDHEEQIDVRSHDIVNDDVERLLQLFPAARSEQGRVDFDKLKALLGQDVNEGRERFGMSWPGKADAIRAAQKQSVATLLPVEKESVDFESTGNVIIEGDNLEVLKLLQKSYLGKIKMIYIDPPYNTGNDFIYPDNYSESLQTYLEYTGQVDDEGKRFSTNTETDGRFHSKWMSMMYPRLVLARNLLTEDGVIFISIDDNEHGNLLEICGQVFGTNNYVASFIWRKKFSLSFVANEYISVHEYVVAFRRSEVLQPVDRRWNDKETVSVNPVFKSQNAESEKIFRKGTRGKERSFVITKGVKKLGAQEIEFLDRAVFENGQLKSDTRVRGRFAIGQKKLDELASEIEITSSGSAYVVKNSDDKVIRPISVFFDYSGGSTEEMAEVAELRKSVTTRAATAQLENLMGGSYFDNPKPTGLVQFLVETFGADSPDSVVLDFFAGSGTTGHAVLAQNAKDGGSRRFILVQLPEPVEEGSEAAKARFETIADITKERVRRAAKEIAKEAGGASKLKLADGSGLQDLGFRVFRLDKSNFQVWDAAAPAGDGAKLEEQLALQVEHVLKGRKGLDVVFEVLLKSKLPLTSNVEKVKLGAGEVWSVNEGVLLVVVDEGVDLAGVRELAKRNPKPETVVFLDRCFGGKDSLKANARKIFQDANIEFKTI